MLIFYSISRLMSSSFESRFPLFSQWQSSVQLKRCTSAKARQANTIEGRCWLVVLSYRVMVDVRLSISLVSIGITVLYPPAQRRPNSPIEERSDSSHGSLRLCRRHHICKPLLDGSMRCVWDCHPWQDRHTGGRPW